MLNNRSFALNFMPQRRSLLLLVSVLVSAFTIGLAAIYQPFLGLGIVVMLLLALGVTIKPDVASLAVFFILYTNAAAVAVRFHGVPSIVGALFLTLLVCPIGLLLDSQAPALCHDARDAVTRSLPVDPDGGRDVFVRKHGPGLSQPDHLHHRGHAALSADHERRAHAFDAAVGDLGAAGSRGVHGEPFAISIRHKHAGQ